MVEAALATRTSCHTLAFILRVVDKQAAEDAPASLLDGAGTGSGPAHRDPSRHKQEAVVKSQALIELHKAGGLGSCIDTLLGKVCASAAGVQPQDRPQDLRDGYAMRGGCSPGERRPCRRSEDLELHQDPRRQITRRLSGRHLLHRRPAVRPGMDPSCRLIQHLRAQGDEPREAAGKTRSPWPSADRLRRDDACADAIVV